MVDGVYESRTFTCEKDVWDVIGLIIEETKEMNEKSGKDFSVSGSVKSQLPFFACNNIIYDKDLQRDIQRYVYCDNFNTQPYPGSYGQQPARWVQKSFIIKNKMNKATNKAIKDGK
mgnify:FL=1|tara:strand:+ start:1907 stop:2254 length:348 start_codon:yes stop_codon:yes gene_type:complete